MSDRVTRIIEFTRPIAGRQAPYELEIDVLTSEQVYLGPSRKPKTPPDYALHTDEFGAITKRENGTVILQGFTPLGEVLAAFLHREDDMFPGSNALRLRYLDELRLLNEDPNCPECAKGALTRKYKQLAKDILQKS